VLEERIQKTGDINIHDLSSRALKVNISEDYMKWIKNCNRKENPSIHISVSKCFSTLSDT
jgi:hypothetical protein